MVNKVTEKFNKMEEAKFIPQMVVHEYINCTFKAQR